MLESEAERIESQTYPEDDYNDLMDDLRDNPEEDEDSEGEED